MIRLFDFGWLYWIPLMSIDLLRVQTIAHRTSLHWSDNRQGSGREFGLRKISYLYEKFGWLVNKRERKMIEVDEFGACDARIHSFSTVIWWFSGSRWIQHFSCWLPRCVLVSLWNNTLSPIGWKDVNQVHCYRSRWALWKSFKTPWIRCRVILNIPELTHRCLCRLEIDLNLSLATEELFPTKWDVSRQPDTIASWRYAYKGSFHRSKTV